MTVAATAARVRRPVAGRTRRPPAPCGRLKPGPAADPEVGLMLRVQRDEPGAFAELIGRYWPRVFGRFYRQFGDRQEAEDLAQNVFLRLYRVRKRYRPAARFATWLYHIAGNVARNAVRSRRRKPLLPIGVLADGEGEPGAPGIYLADHREPPTRPLERAELA